MAKPVCAGCGNDGTKSGLYVQVDARWDGETWMLQMREDEGGLELDCVVCDARTKEVPEDPFFPYGVLPLEPLEAWRKLA